jgi:YesN/AraC family two-component response regulator
MKARLLFVDDEPTIRITLPAILRSEGFDVTVAASAREALDLINRQRFDILLSDLNIGEPGDGFTVVSAMRRTQPEVLTFILTGFPDFNSALEAIRQQVDDYFTKPADVRRLVNTLKAKLAHPRHVHESPRKRVARVLIDNTDQILEEWLADARTHEDLRSAHLTDRQLVDYLSPLLQSLIRTLEAEKVDVAEGVEEAGALRAAAMHAEDCAKQGYNISMLVVEAGILHVVISRVLLDRLLEIDLSTLTSDTMKIGECLNALLKQSIRAFQHRSVRAA